MIIGGLVVVGAVGVGGWLYHHLFVKKLDNRVVALEAKVHGHR